MNADSNAQVIDELATVVTRSVSPPFVRARIVIDNDGLARPVRLTNSCPCSTCSPDEPQLWAVRCRMTVADFFARVDALETATKAALR